MRLKLSSDRVNVYVLIDVYNYLTLPTRYYAIMPEIRVSITTRFTYYLKVGR